MRHPAGLQRGVRATWGVSLVQLHPAVAAGAALVESWSRATVRGRVKGCDLFWDLGREGGGERAVGEGARVGWVSSGTHSPGGWWGKGPD